MRDEYAHTPSEFFRLLTGSRPHLLWLTTNCYSRGLNDPWIKLALIRLARARTRMDDERKKKLFKWATSLVRMRSVRELTPELIDQLMHKAPGQWRDFLVSAEVLTADAPDPVPEHLLKVQDDLDWSELTGVLRGEIIPGRRGVVGSSRLGQARNEFNDACQNLYWQWLARAKWHASLLILDEAHHAKNDATRLASLFRSNETCALLESGDQEQKNLPLLWEKFDRMLFLTATPFQLGHQELIRVLHSFAGARWKGKTTPAGTREEFIAALTELEKRLDKNRLAGRLLDGLWGRLTPAHIGASELGGSALSQAAAQWWQRVQEGSEDPLVQGIKSAIADCRRTKQHAESDSSRPWAALRSWVVRHNRSPMLPKKNGEPNVQRREPWHGMSILAESAASSNSGLPIAADSALPFLLAARAQGEMAAGSGRSRAFFAEGLCSSYEAFHHTREARGDVRDVDDDGVEITAVASSGLFKSLVPLAWYEDQITRLIPSHAAGEQELYRHPKVRAVVDRVVRLWRAGEKVLVFCVYRETVKALYAHVASQLERETFALAADKLRVGPDEAKDWLARITRRLADRDSPFHREIVDVLREPFRAERFAVLSPHADWLVEMLAAYVRSASFVARYLPLEDAEVREALEERQTSGVVIQAGVKALRHTLTARTDGSALTMMRRVEEFLGFAQELAERSQHKQPSGEEDEEPDLLRQYLEALAVYISPRRIDSEEGAEPARDGTYRVQSPVRMVYGDTGRSVRQRLMLAFNSPLFPEVLISSSVLGEGVDLHRFCRHVIHHDQCWNPSTLEQRTGRLDRIRCKAEVARRPILVFEPFLAGSADEKMFRVVRDRERWFQIVMGQKFEFDEATSEQLASRIPLPDELARQLIFDLRRSASPGEAPLSDSALPSTVTLPG